MAGTFEGLSDLEWKLFADIFPCLTDGAGMPLSLCTTPANGDEQAQVIPLLDALHIHTGTRGRPRKRVKVLAADKGYDTKDLRQRLRRRGIRPQIPKRAWKTRKPRGRPIKRGVPRFQAERTFGSINPSNCSRCAGLPAEPCTSTKSATGMR